MDEKTHDFFSECFTGTLEKLIVFADKENYDRDSLIQAFAAMFSTLVEISTFRNYKIKSSDDPAET